MNVAAGGDVDARVQTARSHAVPSRVHRHVRRFRHRNRQVYSSSVVRLRLDQHRAAVHRHLRRLGVKNLLRARVRVGVRHFLRVHFQVRLIARRNAHVTAGNANLNRRIGRNLPVVYRLIAVVLRHSEGVEEAAVAEVAVERAPEVVVRRGDRAQKREKDQNPDEATTAPHRSFAPHVQRPLAQQRQARADQKQRPPMAVPHPERTGIEMAADHQQRNHPDAHQDDRADHRRHARAVHTHVVRFPCVALCAPLIALRAPRGFLLFAIGAPLRLRIVRRLSAAWRRVWRHIRRHAAHDCPSSLSS